jgi:hypothetical protein
MVGLSRHDGCRLIRPRSHGAAETPQPSLRGRRHDPSGGSRDAGTDDTDTAPDVAVHHRSRHQPAVMTRTAPSTPTGSGPRSPTPGPAPNPRPGCTPKTRCSGSTYPRPRHLARSSARYPHDPEGAEQAAEPGLAQAVLAWRRPTGRGIARAARAAILHQLQQGRIPIAQHLPRQGDRPARQCTDAHHLIDE